MLSQNVNLWNENQINDFYNSSVWIKDFSIKADNNINKKEFVKQNVLNPKSWAVAFEFFKKNDLANMPIGKYNLLDDGTYATVSDYMSKDVEGAYFEAHRKFIDIQFVARGEELIGLTTLQPPMEMYQPYDRDKDIEFFSKKESKNLYANSEVFFVFFPSDAHKPCLKVKDKSAVRKIVVKIPYINQ